jgi:hypothetical protein
LLLPYIIIIVFDLYSAISRKVDTDVSFYAKDYYTFKNNSRKCAKNKKSMASDIRKVKLRQYQEV